MKSTYWLESNYLIRTAPSFSISTVIEEKICAECLEVPTLNDFELCSYCLHKEQSIIKECLTRFRKTKERSLKAGYRKKRRFATPKWLTEEHKKELHHIYLNRPKGYHVDHIVPLQGANVSGLHVPWNLQYLTVEDNLRKHNKF